MTIPSLYVHIPFCRRKCFYCSFAIAVAKPPAFEEYLACLAKEMRAYRDARVSSVYIGGGTPGILNEAQLERLFGDLKANFYWPPRAEVTLEINPDPQDITLVKARLLKRLGVNRVSVGAQTFDEKRLRFLGRTHAPGDIAACVKTLRRAGFCNVSLDVIYGFPGQGKASIEKDLRQALGLGPDHISLYSLTVEASSRFHTMNVSVPGGERAAALYEFVRVFLENHGYRQYEVSNFAKRGKASAHNRMYWQGGNYFGIGMAAHAHIDGTRSWNMSRLPAYLTAVREGKSVVEGREHLPPEKRLTEALCFGLRMNRGVSLDKLQDRFGVVFSGETEEKIEQFVAQGWLKRSGRFLQATDQGRLVLDELSARLI